MSRAARAPGRSRGAKRGKPRGPYATGVERRKHLRDAVLAIVREEGAAAITHRAVAQRAGVALGATTYYFGSKEEMVHEAFQQFAAASLEQIEPGLDTFEAVGRLSIPEAVTHIVQSMILERADPSWVVELELILTVARDPSFAPDYAIYQERLDQVLERLMACLGSGDPKGHTRIVLAFVRGFEVDHLARGQPRRWRSRLRGDLTELLESLLGAAGRRGAGEPR